MAFNFNRDIEYIKNKYYGSTTSTPSTSTTGASTPNASTPPPSSKKKKCAIKVLG